MAVVDAYSNTNVSAGKKAKAALSTGDKEIVMISTVEIAAADDDGSKYRLFKAVPSSYIPTEITITCDAITGGTDYDLGLYDVDLGAVVDKDVLMDGQTLASALTRATGHQLGLGIVNIDSAYKTLGELSAETDVPPAYDIVLTGNTVGTAAGTVTVIAKFVQG